MAVPKTTQTKYNIMDGSVQRTTQVTPSLHFLFAFASREPKINIAPRDKNY